MTPLIEGRMTDEIKFQSPETSWDGVLTPEQASAALQQGALMLCGRMGLVADWQARMLRMQGASVAETPPVRLWGQWLEQLALEDAGMPLPLTPLQEAALWQAVIREDLQQSTANGPMREHGARALAREAMRAYRLLAEYRIEPQALAGSAEAEAFARWIAGVQARLREWQGRCLRADLGRLLPSRLNKASGLDLPSMLLLDEAEQPVPLQLSLIEAMRRQGCRVFRIRDDSGCQAVMRLTSCRDERQEIEWAVERVRQILHQRPDARIGLVHARSMQPPLQRRLDEALLPDALNALATGHRSVRARPLPLIEAPMVAQLFGLLELVGRPQLERKQVSTLLRLPWLAGFHEEGESRLRLDLLLRRRNRHRISLAALQRMPEVRTMPRLQSLLQAIERFEHRPLAPAQWVERVSVLLEKTGFVRADGGDAARTDIEIRQVNAMRELLASMVALEALDPRMRWPEFLAQMKAAAGGYPLSMRPRQPHIELLELDEAPGRRFDVLLMLGMDEETLPASVRPLALIPVHLQRSRRMPYCDAQWCMDHARMLLHTLSRRCGEIHFSYARLRQEQEMACSPVLPADCLEESFEPAASDPGVADALEAYDEARAWPVSETENPRGGTAMLADQANCPFRAFARHRLALIEPDETRPGIDPASRGSLMHAALEFVWRHLRGSAGFERFSEAEIDALIGDAVEHAWRARPKAVPEDGRELECRRMRELLRQWLALERRRPEFIVEATEAPLSLQLPEASSGRRLTIRLRADRIDRLAGGQRLVLDYKTGMKQSASTWTGERPEAPQLPLYALAAGLGEGDGVCFARVRAGDLGFEGLSDSQLDIPGIQPCDGKSGRPSSWSGLLQDWRQAMDRLAAEFIDGENRVHPLSTDACRYCGLEAVCRIDELGHPSGERT